MKVETWALKLGCLNAKGFVEDGKYGREWRLCGLLYIGDLVLYGLLEEDLKVMVGCFVEMCRR